MCTFISLLGERVHIDHFILGQVGAALFRAQRQAALLQAALWIVPHLLHDEMLQAWVEACLHEHIHMGNATVF